MWKSGNFEKILSSLCCHCKVLSSHIIRIWCLICDFWPFLHSWFCFDIALSWDSKILAYQKHCMEKVKEAWFVWVFVPFLAWSFFFHMFASPCDRDWVLLVPDCSVRLGMCKEAGKPGRSGISIGNVKVTLTKSMKVSETDIFISWVHC